MNICLNINNFSSSLDCNVGAHFACCTGVGNGYAYSYWRKEDQQEYLLWAHFVPKQAFSKLLGFRRSFPCVTLWYLGVDEPVSFSFLFLIFLNLTFSFQSRFFLNKQTNKTKILMKIHKHFFVCSSDEYAHFARISLYYNAFLHVIFHLQKCVYAHFHLMYALFYILFGCTTVLQNSEKFRFQRITLFSST